MKIIIAFSCSNNCASLRIFAHLSVHDISALLVQCTFSTSPYNHCSITALFLPLAIEDLYFRGLKGKLPQMFAVFLVELKMWQSKKLTWLCYNHVMMIMLNKYIKKCNMNNVLFEPFVQVDQVDYLITEACPLIRKCFQEYIFCLGKGAKEKEKKN